jgi:hypothetical protein
MAPSHNRSDSFPHERLDAWHIARQARVAAFHFTKSLPAGHGDEARQINKAAASVVRNLCEAQTVQWTVCGAKAGAVSAGRLCKPSRDQEGPVRDSIR